MSAVGRGHPTTAHSFLPATTPAPAKRNPPDALLRSVSKRVGTDQVLSFIFSPMVLGSFGGLLTGQKQCTIKAAKACASVQKQEIQRNQTAKSYRDGGIAKHALARGCKITRLG